jgi:hypothetical protein
MTRFLFTKGRHRKPRGRRTLWLIAGVAAVFVLLLGTIAIASHGSGIIDLTYDDAVVSHNTAVFLQGGTGAGTGQYDPFFTVKSNQDTERGHNICNDSGCGDPNYDTFGNKGGSNRTHELLVSAVPTITYNGVDYKEFSLDANDSGADTWMSIDEIKVFLDTQDNLLDYNPVAETFGNDTGLPAYKIYDIDADGDVTVLMVSQGLESGSGVSDITLLIPDDGRWPAECFYGSTTCDTYVTFWSVYGEYEPVAEVLFGEFDENDARDFDWNVSAGFEEWRTQLLPVVNVEKTAEASLTRTWTWTIDKLRDDSWALFTGESGTSDFDVSVDATKIDSNQLITGQIDILNPTGGDVIERSIPAVINSVTDVIDQGGVTTDAVVNCGVTFPYTLGAGDTLSCSYTVSPPNSDAGTNTATVNIDISDTEDRDYTGTAPFDFATGTVTNVDEQVSVSDDQWTPGVPGDDLLLGTANALTDTLPKSFATYSRTFLCDDDEGSHTNTASFVTNDTAATGSDSASVTVACYDISVSKDAATSLTRAYSWTIDKSVSPASWALFTGESGTSDWTVAVDKTGFTDSAWAVEGSITVTNNHPTRVAEITAVTDVVSPAIAASVNCGVTFPHDIAVNGGTLICSYSTSLPDAAIRTNTATATLQLYDFDSLEVGTKSGTDDYTGQASVDFTSPTITEVYASINVTDTNGQSWGPVSDDASWTYAETFSCDSDAGTHNNTATITETGQNDSASVTVACYDISVSKDAATSLTRTYSWTIDKSADQTEVTIDSSTSATVNYSIVVDATYVDSAWGVAGSITVTNNHPSRVAEITAVTDVVSPAIAASVNCGETFPFDIAANGGTLICSYSTSLPDAAIRTNTATATLQLYDFDSLEVGTKSGTDDYTGQASVDFSTATITHIDEEITVTDDYGTPGDTSDDVNLGTVNALTDLLPATLTYQRTFTIADFPACGDHTVINTARFVTNDTGTFGVDSWTILFHIPCDEGLTPGFWQGGNGLFRWDEPNDSDFNPAGGNPFYADQLWKDQTVLFTGPCDPDFHAICEMTMLDIVGSGGTSDWVIKSARDAIAAVLNASHAGVSYPASVEMIQSDWQAALQQYIDSGGTNTTLLQAFHTTYGAFNQLGGTIDVD